MNNKYRGKHIETGEWVYGYLIGTDAIVGEIVDWTDEYFCTEFWYKVDPKTVGQYTGINDKNGKEIYKDDIMKVPDLYETPENTETTYHNDVVSFKDYAFCLGNELFHDDWDYIAEECEVIGNRWDNPDLLAPKEGADKHE